jgi:glycosyltransferase involved in cell wall biosynthesis
MRVRAISKMKKSRPNSHISRVKKKVLFLVVTLEVGGTEVYLLRFIRYIKERNLDLFVLCKRGVSGQLERRFLDLGVEIIYEPLTNFPGRSWLKFLKILNYHKFDSVVDFTGNFSGVPLFLSKLSGIRTRLVFYRKSTNLFEETPMRLILNRLLNILTYRSATKVLSNSKDALSFFYPKKILDNETKFKTISNGVFVEEYNKGIDKDDLRKSLGIPANAFVIGHVGRFHSHKNHLNISKLAKNILPEMQEVYFLLIGRGVKKGFQDLLDHERIVISDVRFDIPNVLQIMDAFYFPSISEGHPNALIEAMISGVPFIASNIPTVKESIPEDYHQYLIDPNDISGVSEIVNRFRKKDFRSQFVKAQKHAIKTFDSKSKFKEFFEQL